MEGFLKKRLAKMPVMHDRYCVATWELDTGERKRVILRSYKNRKAYDTRPEKPSSIYQLKRISDWDGKTGFHRYKHAFTIETRDKKLFQCVAPCAADKVKWMGIMVVHRIRDMRRSAGNVESMQHVEVAAGSGKPRAYTGPTVAQQDVDADQVTETEEQSFFSDHDGRFRTMSSTSVNSFELPHGDKNEPIDWGLCANEDTMYKYKEQEDLKSVLLDKELLDSRGETKTLASDRFLFEEAGASRFGAVVVEGAGRDEEDDDADFVDEDFAVRKAHRENERNMKRRAQKLESNKDLYAEMAAARLADMRKDARIRKSRHGRSRTCLSTGSEESNIEMHDEDQSEIVGTEVEGDLEDTNQRRSSLRSQRSSKSHERSFLSSSDYTNSVQVGYLSDEDEKELKEESGEAVQNSAGILTHMDDAESAKAENIQADIVEAEELRQLKMKCRAERRAKKRLMKEREENRTAMEAAELVRTHRDTQRAREEAKACEEQEKKREKKERREMKEKLKREKAKKRQAKAEVQKLLELKQAEEERRERERMEKEEKEKEKRKSKKKEKYTSPAERIHRKKERDRKRAAAADKDEISNALVVVEKSPDRKAVQEPCAPGKPTSAPAVSSTSSVNSGAAPTPPGAFARAALTAPIISPVPGPAVAAFPSSATERAEAPAAMQAMPAPMYQMSLPPFVPSYPTGTHSMPAYGLAATFGAYPPFYLAPYSYGGPTGLQPASMRPSMGYVAGLCAMNSFGTSAELAPASGMPIQAEPLIGPQLPNLKENTEASLSDISPPPFASSRLSTSPKLKNLPELPDVIEF